MTVFSYPRPVAFPIVSTVYPRDFKTSARREANPGIVVPFRTSIFAGVFFCCSDAVRCSVVWNGSAAIARIVDQS
jgi:hypothetical protein